MKCVFEKPMEKAGWNASEELSEMTFEYLIAISGSTTLSVAFLHWSWDTWTHVLQKDMSWRDTTCMSLQILFNRLYCKFWHGRTFGKGRNDLVANNNSYHRSDQICFLLGYESIAKSLQWDNRLHWWVKGFKEQSKILKVCELFKEKKGKFCTECVLNNVIYSHKCGVKRVCLAFLWEGSISSNSY